MRRIQIGKNKFVGPEDPCLIMMDAGVNHNTDPSLAIKLIDACDDAGVDVVKFQTYKAEAIVTKTAPRFWNPKLDTDEGGTQYDTLINIDDLPLDAYKDMKKRAEELDIVFSSTPFNMPDVEFLVDLGMDVFKVSSSDLTYLELIKEVARTGKPVIISTGLGSIAEMDAAIEAVLQQNNSGVILQHCILSYPCEDSDANLAKMVKMQEIFSDVPVGYSDHTYGTHIPAAAVALGARSIEKHFTLDRSMPDSPDHGFALDPEDTKIMVEQIRNTEKGIGAFVNGPYEAEAKAFLYARKSVTSLVDIRAGETIQGSMLTAKRPGTGISPNEIDFIIGRIAAKEIKADTTITKDHLA